MSRISPYRIVPLTLSGSLAALALSTGAWTSEQWPSSDSRDPLLVQRRSSPLPSADRFGLLRTSQTDSAFGSSGRMLKRCLSAVPFSNAECFLPLSGEWRSSLTSLLGGSGSRCQRELADCRSSLARVDAALPPWWLTTFGTFTLLAFLYRGRSTRQRRGTAALAPSDDSEAAWHGVQGISRPRHDGDHMANRPELPATEAARVLAEMTHELRTPFSLFVKAVDQIPSERIDCTSLDARDKARELLTLLDDLLDVYRSEERGTPLELSVCSPFAIARRSIKLFAQDASSREIGFSLRAEAGVPMRCLADPRRLRQILINLLSNALKCTTHGQICIEISRTSERGQPRYLRFSVVDSGIGILPGEAMRLFAPFTRGSDCRGSVKEGFGLGLTICHRLARAMQGRISLRGVPGVGARVDLDVPLIPVNPSAHPGDAAAHPGARRGASPALRLPAGAIVLVVDDHPGSRAWIAAHLRALGFAIRGAGTIDEACHFLTEERIDAILTDCHMPDGKGWTLARRAGEIQPGISIIACTADSSDDVRLACEAAGIVGMLHKPIDPRSLKDCLSARPPEHAAMCSGSLLHARVEKPQVDSAGAEIERYSQVWKHFRDGLEQARIQALTGDSTTLAGLAHRNRGPAAMVGAGEFQQACQAIESEAQACGHVSAATRAVFIESIDACLRWIEKRQSSPCQPADPDKSWFPPRSR